MAKVDINTKMITLLGDPLKQSFAAQMQNCGYEAAGLNSQLQVKVVRKYYENGKFCSCSRRWNSCKRCIWRR